MTQCAYYFNKRLISQLVSGIARVLEKLPRCFNGTALSKATFITAIVCKSRFKSEGFRVCYDIIWLTLTILL